MKFKAQVGESTLGRCGLRLSPGQGGRAQQPLTPHSPGKSQVCGGVHLMRKTTLHSSPLGSSLTVQGFPSAAYQAFSLCTPALQGVGKGRVI